MRKFTWVILAVQVLFIIWIIAGAAGKSSSSCGSLTAEQCAAATDVGKGIGVFLIVVIWALVDVILGVVWLVTNRKPKETIVYVERPPVPPAT